jgi:hypothetical protein
MGTGFFPIRLMSVASIHSRFFGKRSSVEVQH